MHFSSKHADDVVRGVGGSGKLERFYDDIKNITTKNILTVKSGYFEKFQFSNGRRVKLYLEEKGTT